MHKLTMVYENAPDNPFVRSSCACEACSVFCKYFPGYLLPEDLVRLCPQNENLYEWSERELLASPGAKVVKNGVVVRVRTLVPARNAEGHCKHLLPSGLCAIHEGSPYGCAFFDSHQSQHQYLDRSMYGLGVIRMDWQVNGLYSTVWLHLEGKGLVGPEPEVSRAKLRKDYPQYA